MKRGIVRSGQLPMALVQQLNRSILGLPGIMRINRGPLWLDPAPDPGKIAEVLALLRRPARWWQGGVLSIAPELPAGPPFDRVLRAAGYRRRRASGFRSVRIDLSPTEAQLRANLRKNWRKQLAASDRASVTLEADSADPSFEWLMAHHATMMAERGFCSISVELLRAMRQAAGTPDDFTIVRAVLGGAWVAGMMVYRHGASATALVGWNGPEGRKVHAQNAVLWHVLASARQNGCRWLDLNDIDDGGLPGIANWKRGLGGTEYELAGEFICL